MSLKQNFRPWPKNLLGLWGLSFILILSLALPRSSKAFFAPGETLNPNCLPNETTCRIHSVISVTNGGTGLSSLGSEGQILKVVSGDLAWASDDSGSVSYSAGSGLSLSGDTFALDIDGLTAESSYSDADTLAIYDDSAGTLKKMTRADFLSGVTGGLVYQGSWDAASNAPSLSDATGTQGQYYVVSVASTVDLGSGGINFTVGDWVIHNGTAWEKLDSTNDVQSVFGRTGLVVATAGDYTAAQITNVPAGAIAATTVQNALNELASEKLATSLTSGLIWVGNSSNVANAVALSGEATIDNTGVLRIADDSLNFSEFKDVMALDVSTTIGLGANDLSFTGSGNIGIGTTSPERKMHIQLADSGATPFSSSNGESALVLENADQVYLNLLTPDNKWSGIHFSGSTASHRGAIAYLNSTQNLQFSTAESLRMSINATGVGIGLITPTNALSFVNNAIIDSTGNLTMQSATGYGLNLLAQGTGTLTLDATGSGTINLAVDNDAKAVNVGTGTGGNTINIATDDTTADTINIGSTKDAVSIQSANWNLTDSVLELLQSMDLVLADDDNTLRFSEDDANGDNYVELAAPSDITDNVTYYLPGTDGTDGQVLATDGLGNLSWVGGGGGITMLNGIETLEQSFVVASSGTDFAITSSGSTHTFSIPNASGIARGLVSTGTQTFAGNKTFSGDTTIAYGKTFSVLDMTKGSILFAGAAGVVSQDAGAFFWDETNNELGIGTNDPTSKLDIVSSGGDGIRLAYGSHYWNLDLTSPGELLFKLDGTMKVTFEDDGQVGIGTQNPNAPLHVMGTGTDAPSTNKYFDIDHSSINNNKSNPPISIRSESGIETGGAFVAISDERTKENIDDLNGALSLVNDLRPVTFNYINRIDKGSASVYGVIAQDLEDIEGLESIVSIGTGYVNDVYSVRDVSGNVILGDTSLLSVGQQVEIADADNKFTTTITDITGNGFRVADSFTPNDDGEVVLVGREVDDKLSVSYDQIAMIGVAAVKDLTALTLGTSEADQIADALPDGIAPMVMNLDVENENLVAGLANVNSALSQNSQQIALLSSQLADLEDQLDQSLAALDDDELQASGAVTFESEVTFKGPALFEALAKFIDQVVFSGSVEFEKVATFNSDTAGYAKLHEGNSEVEVTFGQEYENVPIVNITPQGIYQALDYAVSEVDTTGFVIQINPVQEGNAVIFNWTALAVKDPQMSESTEAKKLEKEEEEKDEEGEEEGEEEVKAEVNDEEEEGEEEDPTVSETEPEQPAAEEGNESGPEDSAGEIGNDSEEEA